MEILHVRCVIYSLSLSLSFCSPYALSASIIRTFYTQGFNAESCGARYTCSLCSPNSFLRCGARGAVPCFTALVPIPPPTRALKTWSMTDSPTPANSHVWEAIRLVWPDSPWAEDHQYAGIESRL